MSRLTRILCVEVMPCPPAQGGVTVTTVDAAHLGEIERGFDMVVLGDAALLRLRPEPPVPSHWVGCVTGPAIDAMNEWRRAGLRRIVDALSLDALLQGLEAEPAGRNLLHEAFGGQETPSAVASLLNHAVEPHLTRDVEAWARRAGISRRNLERELRAASWPSPRRVLAVLVVAEVRRMRAGGHPWSVIAAELDYCDASSLLRFLRGQEAQK